MQYYLWRAVAALVSLLPLPLAYTLAAVCGSMAYWLWPRGRRGLRANYARVLRGRTRAERDGAARRSLVNYCKYLVDFARLQAWPPELILRRCHGEASFRALVSLRRERQGVVVALFHFGNPDLGAAAVAARGYAPTIVADTFGDQRLDAHVFRARERLGMRLVPANRAAPSLVHTLREGGMVAMLFDRPLRHGGVECEFFGDTVRVPDGPARLALRTGSLLIPAAFPRLQPGRPDVTTLADFSIDATPSGDEEADVRRLTSAILASHERYVRERPDQWYMFREMWPSAHRRQA